MLIHSPASQIALPHGENGASGRTAGLTTSVSLLLVWSGFALADFTPLAISGYLLLADLLIVIAWLITADRPPLLVWKREIGIPLVLVFTGALLSSLLASHDPLDSLATTFNVGFSLICLSGLTAAVVVRSLRYAWATFFGAIAATLLRTIDILAMIPFGVQFAEGSRQGGVLGMASLFVLLPGIVALVIWGCDWSLGGEVQNRSRLRAALCWTAVAAGVLAITMTRFRALWLSLLFSLAAVVMFFLARDRRITLRIVIGALAAPLVVAMLVPLGLIPEFVQARILGILNTGTVDAASRITIVQDLLPRAAANPFFGIGFNQSHLYTAWYNLHNWPLNMLVENGVLAFFGLVLLPLGCLLLYMRSRVGLDSRRRLLLLWSGASLAGLYVGSQLIANMYEHIFGLMLGVFVGVIASARREEAAPSGTGCDCIRLGYVITTLKEYGGAEAALMRIVPNLSGSVSTTVIVLKDEVPASIVARLARHDVRVLELRVTGPTAPIALVRTWRRLFVFQPDVVVASLFHASVVARLVLPFLRDRPRLVCWQHNERLGGRLRVATCRLIGHRADLILADSIPTSRVVNEGLHIDQSRIRVLDIAGVNTEDFRPAPRSESVGVEVVIGSLGTLTRQKGYDVFIEALSRLPREARERVQAVIAGEGPERLALESLVANSEGVAVEFVGVVGDAAEFLRTLDVYVQPSRWEGRCIAVVEAIATGLPIAASDVGGIGESVQPGNGLLVPPESPNDLADALRQLVEKDELRRAMGVESRRLAESLPSDRDMAGQFEQALLSLARGERMSGSAVHGASS